jgi:succinyl-diaminopimelate desuccinylase
MPDSVLDLACELIRRASVSPDDAGCQEWLARRLAAAGFTIEHLPFGEVRNLWATHGQGGPVLVMVGHTDVVPTGPLDAWSSPPFEPTVRDGLLYGRGAADMKGSVAAMTIALESFVREHADHPGTVALLLTSDEEAEAIDGVRQVAAHFRETGQRIDWCLIGEPSGRERLGDRSRVGRRGSLTGHLVVHGIQGHVANPHLARNPIHELAPALAELCATRWDEGSTDFPPTGFQISNVHAGTGANNVIPGHCEIVFNFRYGTVTSAAELRERTEAVLARHGLQYDLRWHGSGEPFLSPANGRLRAAVRQATIEICGVEPVFDTGGGTSDGRFLAPLGAEVVEIGPVNASIHKLDEHVPVVELRQLVQLYAAVACRLLGEDSVALRKS